MEGFNPQKENEYSNDEPDVSNLYEDLFADMRENPMKYKANVMLCLFGKIPPTEAMKEEDSPIGRFLKDDVKLTFQDLYNNGILPEGNYALEKAIFCDVFLVPQLTIEELGEVPIDRNDVMFVGCPGSGKSSVLAGILNHLHNVGEMKYLPLKNAKGLDGCRPYYNALIRGLSEYKVLRSGGIHNVCFMQLDLGQKRDRKVTVMELNAEVFKALSEANFMGYEIWDQLGLGRCLKNNNPKTLFFLLDYSAIIGKNPHFTAIDQEEILCHALNVFSSDGSGRYGKRNCTMSKVKNVAVIVAKSDLMDIEAGRPLTLEEREDIAFDYLKRSANFMNDLTELCKSYGINNYSKDPYRPFVTTFSLGKFFIGNTVVYDPTDSKRLADFIMKATERRRWLFDAL